MGSGLNRKKNDAPVIRIPKSLASLAKADQAEQVAEICKPSFEVKVNRINLTIPGMKTYLQKVGEIYLIQIGTTTIGKLNTRVSKMVTECDALNVKYVGEIVKNGDDLYSRFIRIL